MKHKILCGDLTKDMNKLMGTEKADIVYSDPPWNNNWINIFRKRAGVAGKQNLETFLKVYCKELKKYSKGIIYIEFGVNIKLLQNILKDEGATQLNLWELPLRKGKQYIWRGYFHKGNYKKLTSIPNKNIPNRNICKWLVEQDKVEDGILLDPCIGKGMSYYLAKSANMNCYGLELSQSKVDKLLSKINKS